jgi:hypothetical protein
MRNDQPHLIARAGSVVSAMASARWRRSVQSRVSNDERSGAGHPASTDEGLADEAMAAEGLSRQKWLLRNASQKCQIDLASIRSQRRITVDPPL